MRTVFGRQITNQSAWQRSVPSPFIGQAQTPPQSTTLEDILKAVVTGGAAVATGYENTEAAKAKAAAAAAQAQTAAAQAKAATAVATAQNPTVLGMPPLLAGVVGLGLAGIIIAIVATR